MNLPVGDNINNMTIGVGFQSDKKPTGNFFQGSYFIREPTHSHVPQPYTSTIPKVMEPLKLLPVPELRHEKLTLNPKDVSKLLSNSTNGYVCGAGDQSVYTEKDFSQ